MIAVKYIFIAIISYFLGSLNFSIILSRTLEKKDIRESGSGNAGATNMLRTYGKHFAVLTMIGDILKVALAILIAFLILNAPLDMIFNIADNKETAVTMILYKEFAGFFCVLGHIFPLYFNFKGGKGVAACTGMVILVDWRIALILFVIFVITIAVSKMISLGSLLLIGRILKEYLTEQKINYQIKKISEVNLYENKSYCFMGYLYCIISRYCSYQDCNG